MATFREVQEKSDKYLMNIYGRFPIQLVDGHDAVLIDSQGKEYDDFLAGISVCNLGYSNPGVEKSIKEASEKLIHTSNFFYLESQADLAQALCENSFADKAFFCNSGGEANEGALKLAKKRAFNKYGPDKDEVIYLSHSFHGRTINTLAVTDNARYSEGYWPKSQAFKRVDSRDLESVEAAINKNTCAVILEPVQGEGGIWPMDQAFMEGVRALCDEFDAALIFDEIQSGMARTGRLWAYDHYGVQPDIMTLAKALANGVPIGAVLAKGDFADTFQPGDHGTTFGGNPLATSVGACVVRQIIEDDLASQVEDKGAYFKAGLEDLAKKHSCVREVRGLGLMLGLDLEVEGGPIVDELLERGTIINCTASTVLRFLPPFVIRKDQVDRLLNYLDDILAIYN